MPRPEDPVLREARATTRHAAKTFSLACLLLPRGIRDDVYRLYLVFRTLDDLVDHGHPEAEPRIAAVEGWASHDTTTSREARVLADLDRRHRLPRHALADFCAGMRSDLDHHQPETEADLDRYCHQVAGTVGLVMAAVLGTTGEGADEAAAALGAAMQRTNILRDIDEDHGNGRVYLARQTVAAHGGSLAPGRREAVLRDGIARADALYDRGLAGIPHLDAGRFAIRAAANMYREILREIERGGYGAGRAVVPAHRRLAAAIRPLPHGVSDRRVPHPHR